MYYALRRRFCQQPNSKKWFKLVKLFWLRGIEFSPADHALRLSFVRHAVGNPAQVIRYLDASSFADAS